MTHIRLTAAQAMVRYLSQQMVRVDGKTLPLFAGCWAIFGHGNVAGLGEALHGAGEALPTYRAHNEQAMAHAAVAYAKQMRRARMMVCTTSIGPGATNMVTAAAMAYVNRLPVLLVPGDVFANRMPDPVLQQVENFADGTVSANDCFRPVSAYFDRITRPEQLLSALPRALAVLTDPALCGPVTLAFCQDVQAEAYDYPLSFFAHKIHHQRRAPPDALELREAIAALSAAKHPLIIAGGGVLFSGAEAALAEFAQKRGIPVAETQAGKASLVHSHPCNMGALGVTGTGAANALAEVADVILAIGSRLADFTTGSWSLFKNPARKIIGLNVQPFDASKHGALSLVADALTGLQALDAGLGAWKAAPDWIDKAGLARRDWFAQVATFTNASNAPLPSDAQVIGAVQRGAAASDIVVSAAGGLPGEMHKLWQAGAVQGYHMEYGFSTMGYEIAGGLGVKLAHPHREVIVLLGDGSYLMMNSEIATSIMLGLKLIIVVNDNGGYGCINRLQGATGGAPFNNMLINTRHVALPAIDFAMHARSLGAQACKVAGIAEFEAAMQRARAATTTQVIVIDTDAGLSTDAGGHWWDVAVPEVSVHPGVKAARIGYEAAIMRRRDL